MNPQYDRHADVSLVHALVPSDQPTPAAPSNATGCLEKAGGTQKGSNVHPDATNERLDAMCRLILTRKRSCNAEGKAIRSGMRCAGVSLSNSGLSTHLYRRWKLSVILRHGDVMYPAVTYKIGMRSVLELCTRHIRRPTRCKSSAKRPNDPPETSIRGRPACLIVGLDVVPKRGRELLAYQEAPRE